MATPLRRRVPRPAVTRAKLYRAMVPAVLIILAAVTALLLVLAGGILVGIVPYPGR